MVSIRDVINSLVVVLFLVCSLVLVGCDTPTEEEPSADRAVSESSDSLVGSDIAETPPPQVNPVGSNEDSTANVSGETTVTSVPEVPADPVVSEEATSQPPPRNPVGITVTDISGNTTETGGTATFTAVLIAEPLSDVTIGVSSSDDSEGRSSTSTLVFTTSNWGIPQNVTVTGVDDNSVDGSQNYVIVLTAATSDDPLYSGLDPADVSVSNVDNENAAVIVSSISGETSEAFATATFTAKLSAQPSADVTIPISSSDTSEGTVNPSSLTFTSANWNALQTVTVTGIDDSEQDGEISYSILLGVVTTTDSDFSAINPGDVTVGNTDNDSAGISKTVFSSTPTEDGGYGVFGVYLNSQPTSNVTIAILSSDTSEGTVSPALLIFTPVNWQSSQVVTVTGVDDILVDPTEEFTVIIAGAVSEDSNYSGIDLEDVPAQTTDDESPGFVIDDISGDTNEAGATATVQIKLLARPASDVVIPVSSNDTSEGTVSPASLTYTSVNWGAYQTVTVTGVNDFSVDGNQNYEIVFGVVSSSDGYYNTLNPDDVSLSNTDDETADITISTISQNTTESGGTATFTVVLTSQPTSNVILPLVSSDSTEGTVSHATVTFTSVNWNAEQEITVTGVDDDLVDGNRSFYIYANAVTSSDSDYSGQNPADISVTNNDDDSAGFDVTTASGATTEGGVTATFTVQLISEPYYSVSMALSSSDTSEATISPSSLTFTSGNWNMPRTVTLTGVNDYIDDGNIQFNAEIGAFTSSDSAYNGLDPGDVVFTNTDDDTPEISVGNVSGTVSESGGSGQFVLTLQTQPTNDVTIALTSSDTGECTVTDSVTLTSANFLTGATVTIAGVDDDIADGNQSCIAQIQAASSVDSDYNGMDANDVTVSVVDNDNVGFVVSDISNSTTEAGTTATATVKLTSEPTANVIINVSSGDATEGAVSPSSLTFTSGNWDDLQTITVTPVDDATFDGDISYDVLLAAASSADGGYNGQDPNDVSLTNIEWSGSIMLGTATEDNLEDLELDVSNDALYVLFYTSSTYSPHTNQGGFDSYVVKYRASSGKKVWSYQLGGADADYAHTLAVNSSGDIYVAGTTYSDLIGADSSADGKNYFIQKINSDGTVDSEVAIQISDGSFTDMVIDSSDNIYTIGHTAGDWGGASAGSIDGVLVKYNSSLVQQWVKQYGTSRSDTVVKLTIDPDNSRLYIVGETEDELPGTSDVGMRDNFFVSYPMDGGEQLFAKLYGNSSTYVWAKGISYVGGQDNPMAYIYGWSYSGMNGVAGNGGYEAYIMYINATNGDISFTNLYSQGNVDEKLVGGCTDASGNAFTAAKGMYYYDGVGTGYSNYDVFAQRITTLGVSTVTNIRTSWNDLPGAVVCDNTNNKYFVTGLTGGSLDPEYANKGLNDIFIVRINSTTMAIETQ